MEWDYFADGEANIGSPEFGDLLLLDNHYDRANFPCCIGCSKPIGGICVELRNGVVADARAYTVGEFDEYGENVDIFLVEAGGDLLPMPEWYDREMSRMDC